MDAVVTPVRHTHRSRPARRWKHRLAVIWIVLALAAFETGTSSAQPAGPGTGGGSYGYDQSCNKFHDKLNNVGIPGLPSLGDLASGLCKASNVATHPGQAVGAAADKAWDMAFGKVVASLLDGLGQGISLSMAFWIRLPNDALANTPGLLNRINDYTYEAQVWFLILSMLVCGVRLASARRHASMEQAAESFRVLARSALASIAWGTVLVLGTQLSDSFANWMIDDASGGNARGVAQALVRASTLQAFSPGLVLILAIVGLFGALAQIVLSVVRQGLLIVVAAVLPLAAAGSGTAVGRGSYDRLLSWSLAFLLYKPLAAMVYTVAFITAGATADPSSPTPPVPTTESGQRALVGIVLLCSAAFTLPAILRLVTPIAGMSGGAGATTAAGAMALAGGSMALAGRLSTGTKDSGGRGTVNSPPGGPPPNGTRSPGPTGPRGGGPTAGGSGAAAAGAARTASNGGMVGGAVGTAAAIAAAGTRMVAAGVEQAASPPAGTAATGSPPSAPGTLRTTAVPR